MHRTLQHWPSRCVVAFVIVLAAVLLRRLLTPVIGHNTIFLLLYPSAMVISVLMGIRVGLVAAVAGVVATYALVVPPHEHAWGFEHPLEAGIVLFAVAFAGHLGQSLRDAREKARSQAAATEQAMEALRAAQERIRLGLQIARAFTFDWDVAAGEVERSGQMRSIIGDDADRLGTPDAFLDMVHPEDRDHLRRLIGSFSPGNDTYETRFRVVLSDGHTLAFREAGRAEFDSEGRLRRIFGLAMDVTEQDRIERELREARDVAEAASRAKDAFLATLSHELRTPLTPVLLTAGVLGSRRDLPTDVREDLDAIRRDVELEARLIDDLLDVTRIVRGKFRIDPVPVDLHALLRKVVDLCGHCEGAPFSLDLGAARFWVRGDAVRLRQAFWNLLNNARKFTPPSGRITIATADAGERLRICVRDNGRGIPSALLPRLFHPFEQGDAAAGSLRGLGLGLAITRAIVEAHGGRITASSDGEDCGAAFTVEIDAIPSHRLPSPAKPVEAMDGRPLRILVVEDHEPARKACLRLLASMGHEAIGAASMKEALVAAEAHAFDLLISDLGLPDGSGHDLMRCLGATYGLPGIALSGYGMEEDIARSRAAGFLDHLVKPVSVERLEAALRGLQAHRDTTQCAVREREA